MHTMPIITVAVLTLSGSVMAASTPCSATHALGNEDRSIMASVQGVPVTTPEATSSLPNILFSAPDPYGRLNLDDLAQIQSVQPEGRKMVLCTTTTQANLP